MKFRYFITVSFFNHLSRIKLIAGHLDPVTLYAIKLTSTKVFYMRLIKLISAIDKIPLAVDDNQLCSMMTPIGLLLLKNISDDICLSAVIESGFVGSVNSFLVILFADSCVINTVTVVWLTQ